MGQGIRRGIVASPRALAAAALQAGSRGGGSGYLERRGKEWMMRISVILCMHAEAW